MTRFLWLLVLICLLFVPSGARAMGADPGKPNQLSQPCIEEQQAAGSTAIGILSEPGSGEVIIRGQFTPQGTAGPCNESAVSDTHTIEPATPMVQDGTIQPATLGLPTPRELRD